MRHPGLTASAPRPHFGSFLLLLLLLLLLEVGCGCHSDRTVTAAIGVADLGDFGLWSHGFPDDPSFIVLTETKFSFRCIPVGIGTLLTGLGSKNICK